MKSIKTKTIKYVFVTLTYIPTSVIVPTGIPPSKNIAK